MPEIIARNNFVFKPTSLSEELFTILFILDLHFNPKNSCSIRAGIKLQRQIKIYNMFSKNILSKLKLCGFLEEKNF